MHRPKFIFLKRVVIGFVTSVLAVFMTVWAMRTYVPQANPILLAVGATFATFYCMALALRGAVREAYQAGEIGRRLPTRRRTLAMQTARDGAPHGVPARTIFSADADALRRSADDRVEVGAGQTGQD
ncbi:MAG TPA: hypothetical protein P5081_06065 [Phycisphaerae bacterium]|nr:hypothetical protein [Phycisphaerae bacterium]HRW52433.1 hypothetical protein [Phycisphaerae bacterium]